MVCMFGYLLDIIIRLENKLTFGFDKSSVFNDWGSGQADYNSGLQLQTYYSLNYE